MTRQELAPFNLGARLDEQDEKLARLYRALARQGRIDLIDVIFGDDVPRLLRGDAPRLKAVA